jgi:large subunit ribosomal protein L19e
MNLKKKKILAAKTLKVGIARIVFLKPRLDEIKEAITKQDIKKLNEDGAILIKNIKGTKKVEKKAKKRGPGNIKKKINKRKRDYITMTRKLRKHISGLKKQGELSNKEFTQIRKKIKNKEFKSKAHLKEHIKRIIK